MLINEVVQSSDDLYPSISCDNITVSNNRAPSTILLHALLLELHGHVCMNYEK